ncbi:DUF3772 domain-containing protein [Roseivivax sediminis]|uniref:Small-conductance mechanosensitive channel n=1 Tax=Roseivivax sediminis TaxID=936889 RepID=A0A1I1S9P4_9RHOB|nr:DUF3772 domain-containing protein [Roseivivax sediminis]SFD43221.1 Small-conductance mechanosensitive channel [Roseivivax sediminis]
MRALRTFLAAFALWAVACASLAQESYDYGPFEEAARSAEEALAEEDAADATLETLRGRLAEFRADFATLRDTETARTETLRAQINALGRPPEQGGEESEIAERRAQLEAQLAEARAPVVAAEEAFTRADGLIREIDQTIRERQAERLLSRGPPPVNPVHWPAAFEELLGSLRLTLTLPENGWITPEERDQLLETMPAVIGLASLGLLLFLRGARWAELAVAWLRKRTRRGSGVWRFLLSLGEIFLPLLGIVAIVAAAETTGLLAERTLQLLYAIPASLAVFFYVRWLAQQTFSSEEDTATLPIRHRRMARYYFFGIAILLVLRRIALSLAELDDYAPETVAIVDFPLVVLSGILLFRLGQIFTRADPAEADDGTPQPDGILFRIRIARVLGRLMVAIGIAAPVLAAAGYANLSEALIYPMIRTLILFGTILVVLRFVSDLYTLFTNKSVQETNSLIPVVAGFAMALLALPIVALIWGARVTDLTELWAAFTAGFTLGDTRISPSNILTFLMVFVIGFGLTRLLQGGLRSAVLPKTKIDLGGRNAIVSGIGYMGILLAALAAFAVAGINLSSLAIVAGALSVGIGFGLQNIVQNFVSGIILLIERPIGEGDWIEVNGTHGFVKAISVRSTRIETFDMFDVIVPNGDFISGTVTNYTRGKTIGRLIVPISVAYGTDTRQVERILTSIARAHPQVLMNPEPFIYFVGYENSALNFEIRVFLVDILEILVVRTEMNHQIAERFAEAGIEIPFPQRDIWLRNPETLVGEGESAHRSFAGEGQGVREPQAGRRRRAGSYGDVDG